MLEDFEGPLPGPRADSLGVRAFGATAMTLADLTVTQEITDLVAFVEYRVTRSIWILRPSVRGGTTAWVGSSGFGVRAYGAAGGQPGEDNPANYMMSFDIKIEGVVSGDEVVDGNVSLIQVRL